MQPPNPRLFVRKNREEGNRKESFVNEGKKEKEEFDSMTSDARSEPRFYTALDSFKQL